ncbi:MAG: SPOR domain-containing protein [Polyangiaceae bacterium]|nr:SPOR domain-containing protein [Polyangiaceae bacterium]
MDSANVRNLDQIQEQVGHARPLQFMTIGLGALVLGLLTVVAVTVIDRRDEAQKPKLDPLEELVKQTRRQNLSSGAEISAKELTFPKVLSDHGQETTALSAVKDERGRLVKPNSQAAPPAEAEWVSKISGQIPSKLQAAGEMMNQSSVTLAPKDPLVALAVRASEAPAGTIAADPGNDGGLQLQVASFQSMEEADSLVSALRQRGHQAFRIAAVVPGKGTWHRVRIGPFKTRFEADRYKRAYEAKEHMNGYVVDPEQVKRAEEIKDAKAKSRAAARKKNSH